MVGDFFGRLLGRRPLDERGDSSAPVPAATPSDEQVEPEAPGPLGQAGMRAQRLALGVISRRAVHSMPRQGHHSAGILSLALGMAPRWAAGVGVVGAGLRRVAEGLLRRSPLGLAHWRTYPAPYVPEEFSPVWREPRHEDNLPEVTPGQPGEGMPRTTLRPPIATRRPAAPLRRPGQSAPSVERRVSRATPPMGARSKAPIARVPASSIRRRRPGVALHRPTIHVDRPMASGIHSPIVSGSIEPVAPPEKWSAREYEHARSRPDRQPASVAEFLFGPEGGQSSDSGQSLRPRESSGPWEPPPSVPARPSAPRPAPSAGVAGLDTSGLGPRAYRQSGPPQSQEDGEQPQSSRASIVQRSRSLVARGVALVFRKPAARSPGPAPSPGVPARPETPAASVPRDTPRQATHAGSAGTYRGWPRRQEAADEVGVTRRPRGLIARAVDMVFARRQAPASAQQEGASAAGAAPPVRREGHHAPAPRMGLPAEGRPAGRQQPTPPVSRGSKGNVSRVGQAPGVEGHQPGPARETDERPASLTASERPLRARAPEEATPTRGRRAGGPPAGLVRRSLQVASRAREMVLRKPSLPATSAARTGEQPAPRQSRPGGPGATGRMAGRPAERRVTPPSPSTVRPQAADERPDADIRDTAPDVARPAPGQATQSWPQQAGQVLGGQAARQRPGATRGQAEVAPSLDVQDASSGDWQRPRPALASQAPGRPSGILRRSVGLALRTRDLVFRRGASASPTAQPFPASSQRPAPARAGHRPRGDTGQGYDRPGVARAPRMPRVTRVARMLARRSVGMALQAGEMVFRKRTVEVRDSGASPSMSSQTSQVDKEASAVVQPGPRSGRGANLAAESGHVHRERQAPARPAKLQASATLGPQPAASRVARVRQAVRRSATTVLHARELVFRKWTPSGVQSGRMDAHAVAASAARRASVQAREDASAQGSPLPRQAQAGFHAQHEGHAADEARPLARQRRLSAPLMRSFSPRPVGRQAPAERRPEAAEWPVTPTPARGERRASPMHSGPVWLGRTGGNASGVTAPEAPQAQDALPLATAPYRTPHEARGQARLPGMAPPAVQDARHGASGKGTVRRKPDAHVMPASNGNGRLNGATPLPGPEHIQLAWQSARPSGSRGEEGQPRPGEHRDGEQPAPELKPEQVELLASRIYSYIKQKLAMERERHGRPGFPLWP